VLERALESLTHQTFKHWELLIIDDGSSDSTRSLCHSFASEAGLGGKMHYHFQPNQGLWSARNAGVQRAAGAYVTFLDSDDEYLPEHLLSRYQIIRNTWPALLHGGVKAIGDDYVPDRHDPSKTVAISECTLGGTFFIRKDVIEVTGGFRELSYAEDSEFAERVAALGGLVVKVTEPTYLYHRTQEDSITRKVEAEKR
jgi:glycosyltransferase involved in cell wall biosynthesis